MQIIILLLFTTFISLAVFFLVMGFYSLSIIFSIIAILQVVYLENNL